MQILVTGGAGYIGSVVTEELVKSDYQVVVYDNLSKGKREAVCSKAEFVCGDLLDGQMLRQTLVKYDISAVVHLAADSLVGESAQKPDKYYRNNLIAGLELLDAMLDSKVFKIVFSSTAAVYGVPEKQPIEEDAILRPINPYGETKLSFEKALEWYSKAYNLKYISLRYFNAAGATKLCGECHEPETHLIPLILQTAAGKREAVEIYGNDYPTRDGTCVRDYVHVVDLAYTFLL